MILIIGADEEDTRIAQRINIVAKTISGMKDQPLVCMTISDLRSKAIDFSQHLVIISLRNTKETLLGKQKQDITPYLVDLLWLCNKILNGLNNNYDKHGLFVFNTSKNNVIHHYPKDKTKSMLYDRLVSLLFCKNFTSINTLLQLNKGTF